MVNFTLESGDKRSSDVTFDHLYKVTGLINKEAENEKKENPPDIDVEKVESVHDEPADFETAIAATGYGRFHILLILSAMPAYWSTVYVSTTMSYTLTGAECDLGITMMDKGLLNSISYAGMIISAVIWGYLSDTLGRKKILVIGFISLGLVEFIGSLSQTFWMLLVAKFFSGFVSNGPFAVLITYIAEMHSTTVRAKVMIFSGLFFSMGLVSLPLIAWGIIPQDWDFSYFNGAFVIHSWNIFLALFFLPPLISGLALLNVPESPKFLMSRGRNDEAMKIFQTIYSKNTGQPPKMYPIKTLVEELSSSNKNDIQNTKGFAAVIGGVKQMGTFLTQPYLNWLLLLCFLNMAAMFVENSLRLWYPQISGILEDYNRKHTESVRMCELVSSQSVSTSIILDEQSAIKECVRLSVGASTYLSSVIVGCTSTIFYVFVGFFVNKIGKKRLLTIFYTLTAIFPIALPWTSNNTAETVALFSVYLSFTGTCASTLSTVVVDLFPTKLRAMSVAAFMLCGRIGTIIGNLIFPALLQTGCYPPFFVIAAVVLVCAAGCSLLPRTTLKKLE